jgi:hypothetical protein
LRADDGLFHHVRGIAGDLTRNAEQLAEVTFALFQQRGDFVDFLLVVVELGRQRFAACLRRDLGFLRFGQNRSLLRAIGREIFQALRVLLGFGRAGVLYLLQQLVERYGGSGGRGVHRNGQLQTQQGCRHHQC